MVSQLINDRACCDWLWCSWFRVWIGPSDSH